MSWWIIWILLISFIPSLVMIWVTYEDDIINNWQKIKFEIKQKIKNKKLIQKSLLTNELEQNETVLSQIIGSGKCPDCGIWDMYEGPSGGMSTNINCGNCGSWFNYTPGFSTQRIHKNYISKLKNASDLDKKIINEWNKIKLSEKERNNARQAQTWCENNAQGYWSMNSSHFYFDDETDAMAFKIIFGE